MKFATMPNGKPDGQLHIISRDLTRAAPAKAADTLQSALENWSDIEAALQQEYDDVNNGDGDTFDPTQALAPLPRAWQWLDGSDFESHSKLMEIVFGIDPIETDGRPLMYQGVSDRFIGAGEDVPFPSDEDGIDFEGEFGIITGTTPMGTNIENAENHIRLIVQINDWSLRRLAPVEMKTGFGWVQAKPACSVAPIAVTPDELGSNWRDGRVDLLLTVHFRGEQFGAASGFEMAHGFHGLLVHAAYSRNLPAGTVIGSGTVSNENYREVGSSCIAERRGIEAVDNGEPSTPFMSFGETVRMEASLPDGSPLFGAIDQKIVKT